MSIEDSRIVAGELEATGLSVADLGLGQDVDTQDADVVVAQSVELPKSDRLPESGEDSNRFRIENGIVSLPAAASLDDGRDLVLVQADGTEIIVIDGARHPPTSTSGASERAFLPRFSMCIRPSTSFTGPEEGSLGSTATVGKVLTHVKKLNATAQILGTETWPVAAFANPAANGAIIGASEQEGSALIADRFKRHKGRTLTPNAARAYDSVAIASGLVRAGGAEALTAPALASPTGFRGVSGVFRFNANGSVERQLGIYKIEGGKLVPLQAAGASF